MKMMRVKRYAGYLAQVEIWPVAFFILISMVWPPFLPVAVACAAAFWAIRWLAYRRLSVRTPVDWPVILLGIMILVTFYATALPEITKLQVIRLLSGITLFYAIANWASTNQRLLQLRLGASLAGLTLALSAPFSVQWAIGKIPFLSLSFYERFTVWVSDAIHPNVLAGSLILLLPIIIGWLLFDWGTLQWTWRIGLSAVILVMLAVLILCVSRGAWMAIAVGLAVMVILRWRWGWVLILLAGLMAALGVYRLGIATFLDLLASGATSGGVDGRLDIWSRAIFMIRDFPFTGIGLGLFGKTADIIYPFLLHKQGSIPHAHNLFLQVSVDLGIPGLIAWLGTLIGVIAASWKIFWLEKRSDFRWMTGLGAGLLGSQAALVVHGLTDAVTWGMVRSAPLVWGIWGIAIAALLVLNHEIATQKP
jgi:putative inorganic carbon (hco3(-)) transporter